MTGGGGLAPGIQGLTHLITLSPLCCHLGQFYEETANSLIVSSPKFIMLASIFLIH